MADSTNLLSLVASLGADTTGFDKTLDGALGKFTKIAGIIATPIKMAVNVAWDFGKDVLDTGLEYEKNVQAVFALTQATDDAAKSLFEQEVIAQAAASTFTTAQVAAAGTYEALGGWDLSETTAGLHGIIVTAEAAGEDLESVAEIIVPLTNAFHVGSDQAMHFGNVLTAAATDSSTDILQIGHAMKYVAPIAAALDYTLDDTAVLLELLGNDAIVSGMAGRSLRNMFTRIATDAGATSNKLGALGILTNRLGVSFYTTEGEARPLLDVIGEMRTAWQGLDEDKRNAVTQEYGGFDAVKQNIENDIATLEWYEHVKEEAQTFAEKDKIQEQIDAIIEPYKELLDEFDAYDPTINKASDSLHILNTRLEGLSQQEQIDYAKRIGNLQGLAAVISIMNVSAEDYKKALASIQNSEGTADKMREDRLNGLWGDLARFNSEYNALKTEIFVGAKEPLREIVQIGTSALTSIREAIEKGGLEEGIKELANQIRSKKRLLAPLFESIGEAAAPLFASLLDTLIHDALPAVETLGASFLGAFFTGMGDALRTQPRVGAIGIGALLIPLGQALRGFANSTVNSDMGLGINNLIGITSGLVSGLLTGNLEDAIYKIVDDFTDDYTAHTVKGAGRKSKHELEYYAAEIQELADNNLLTMGWNFLTRATEVVTKGIDAATDPDKNTEWPVSITKLGERYASIWSDVFGDNQWFAKIFGNSERIIDSVDTKPIEDKLSDSSESGITDGIDAGADAGTKLMETASTEIADDLAEKISDGGIDGAVEAAVNTEEIMAQTATTIAGDLANEVGGSGKQAGETFIDYFKRMVGMKTVHIPVVADVSGLPMTHNARAMSTGRIFDHPTIFGYADGALQMAGDAGAEAVVGVNSLRSMITGAVASAVSAFQPVGRNERPINIVFELEGAQKWIYRLNKAEEQRVGLKLSTGGSY